MKWVVSVGLAIFAMGCGSQIAKNADPLKQTYVHKYGLKVEKNDWDARGGSGQVFTSRKDGVTVTESYNESALHGPTTYTFPHSTTIAKIELYNNGTLVSETDNFRSGLPQCEIEFLAAGERHVTEWYEDGSPRSGEVYFDNFLSWGEYYTPGNVADATVSEGSGLRLIRNESGFVTAEEVVKGGAVVKATSYFSSGDIEAIAHFSHGKRDGQRRTFLEGGEPATIEDWVSGELHGSIVSFQNGEKKSIIPYVHGTKHGTEQILDASGQTVEEVSWKRGNRHGPDTFYVDGSEQVDWYHHNHIVSRHTYEKLNPREF